MKKFAKLLALALSILMLVTLAACASDSASPAGDDPSPASDPKKIGISMPTNSLQRWNEDGDYLKAQFESAGHTVDLQYANNDPALQVTQIENMISGGCDVLVIAAEDCYSLTQVLATAESEGVTVVAHDRLIMESDAVDFYATFNNWMVGTMQGEFIETALDLANTEGPYNIEFFTGDPGDNNINFFFGGAMEVLQPYLTSGVLNCPSNQTDMLAVATLQWDAANAQSRMENLISTNGYGPNGTKLDAVMCNNDSTAYGVVTALLNAGYTAENLPIVTGQDCDRPNVIRMRDGLQSMSVFKDTRILAEQVKDMVIAHINGETVPSNTSYDNDDALDGTDGERLIPSFECELALGTPDNLQELLIDSGYYTEEELTA